MTTTTSFAFLMPTALLMATAFMATAFMATALMAFSTTGCIRRPCSRNCDWDCDNPGDIPINHISLKLIKTIIGYMKKLSFSRRKESCNFSTLSFKHNHDSIWRSLISIKFK